jgi:hypothetical protein
VERVSRADLNAYSCSLRRQTHPGKLTANNGFEVTTGSTKVRDLTADSGTIEGTLVVDGKTVSTRGGKG